MLLEPNEISTLTDNWSKTVRAVWKRVRAYLLNQYQISDDGNRYQFFVYINDIRHTGIEIWLRVYDHYEDYWFINKEMFVRWSELE